MMHLVARWFVVGAAVNAILYIAYLGLTRSLLGPKPAMTIVYLTGVVIGFVGHRKWSFRHAGRMDSAFIRYVAAYALGYLINLLGLGFGIESLGLPHEWVQATMVVVVAITMFVLQRYFVFAVP